MKILFVGSHLLYFKVLLPVMASLAERGHMIRFQKTRPDCLGFSPRYFGRKPTRATFVNRAGLRYVADAIELPDEKKARQACFRSTWFSPIQRFDAVVGTTKDLSVLAEFKHRGVPHVWALGYEHLPVLMSLTEPISGVPVSDTAAAFFLGSNRFAEVHKLRDIVQGAEICDHRFVNFAHLDPKPERQGVTELSARDRVLVMHPGGYRKVITNPGAGKKESYERQRAFLEKICDPILEAGLKPVIKIHPLHANYHSAGDVRAILNEMAARDSRYASVDVARFEYWSHVYRSRLIVTFGSSGFYELFAAGVSNVVACSFLTEERANKFEMFDDLFVRTYEDYRAILQPGVFENRLGKLSGLTLQAKQAYGSLSSQAPATMITAAIESKFQSL